MTVTNGTLYVIATPIGNLGDISLRALETLRHCDFIAAEDTRVSKKLLTHYQIDTQLIALHAHNEADECKKIVKQLQQGKNVALISDAGTPTIQDPGVILVQQALENQITVCAVPGANALIAALSISGLNGSEFYFAGFLSHQKSRRRQKLMELKAIPTTLILYESTHRLLALLEDIQTLFSANTKIVLAKELTKKFETVCQGSVEEIIHWLQEDENRFNGEFVILIANESTVNQELDDKTRLLVDLLLKEISLKSAVEIAHKFTEKNKKQIYDYALKKIAEMT